MPEAIGSNVLPVLAFAADDLASSDNSVAIDTQPFTQAMIVTNTATLAGTLSLQVEQSDDGSTGWTEVTDAEITVAADGVQYGYLELHSVGRYIRIAATAAGGGSATTTVEVVLSNPKYVGASEGGPTFAPEFDVRGTSTTAFS